MSFSAQSLDNGESSSVGESAVGKILRRPFQKSTDDLLHLPRRRRIKREKSSAPQCDDTHPCGTTADTCMNNSAPMIFLRGKSMYVFVKTITSRSIVPLIEILWAGFVQGGVRLSWYKVPTTRYDTCAINTILVLRYL